MTNKDFIINEKELLVFIRFNSIYEKYIAETNVEAVQFVPENNKDALIEYYTKKISKEKNTIIKNTNICKISNINFWALNRNYEEIINSVVKDNEIAFIELWER